MRLTYYSILLITVLVTQPISAQNFKLQNIEVDFNENSIGRSLQLQLQAKTGPLNISLGLRYHLKLPLKYNNSLAYYRTMHPVKFIQRFGPVFTIIYLYQPQNFYAAFFGGYKSEVGIMARRLLRLDDVTTNTAFYLHKKSPMVRWENQLILGSVMPVTSKIKFRVYGGVGISGIFRVFEENTIFLGALNGRTYEFSASFGGGLSYLLFN